MKTWKQIFTYVLAFAVLLGVWGNTAFAKEAYTYTVTFYAGNQGVMDESNGLSVSNKYATIIYKEDRIVVSGLNEGDTVGLNAQAAVELEAGSKYYVQGIRKSGRDNNTVAAAAFIVHGDADYVVAYGIKGNQVKYTVQFQDAVGNVLASNETYYGNIGDKPVVAYKYIDGYYPKTFGLTKTLSANETENVFTFVYDKMPTTTVNQVVNEETVTVGIPGTTVVGGGTGAAAGTGAGAGAAGNAGEAVGGEEIGGETTEETEISGGTQETPEEDIIVDLDEEEVPLAGTEEKLSGEEESPMKLYAALIAAGVAALVVIGVLLYFLMKSKKATDAAKK